MTPGPHTLTVGELVGMLSGLDPAAYTDCESISRKAGEIIQYKLTPNAKTLLDHEEERYEELQRNNRRAQHELEQLRVEQRAEVKRLALVRKTLRGLALHRAAPAPRLP